MDGQEGMRAARSKLMTAIEDGDVEAIKQAIAELGDVNIDFNTGFSPMTLAAGMGNMACMAALFDAGASLDRRDRFGDSPLEKVILGPSPVDRLASALAWLLDHGADASAPKAHGRTPLVVAIRMCSDEACAALIAAGADVNAADQAGETALLTAAERIHVTSTLALIGAGVELDHANAKGETALMRASRLGQPSVHALIDAGAGVDIQDQDGMSAAMWAASQNDVRVLSALIEAGADWEAKNIEGLGAEDLARSQKSRRCEQMLRSLREGQELRRQIGDAGKRGPRRV